MLTVKGGPDGLAYFDIDGPSASAEVCDYLAMSCVSFYFEPRCFDERTIVVNGAAAGHLAAHLNRCGILFNMRRA